MNQMEAIRKNGKKLVFFLPFLILVTMFLLVPLFGMIKKSLTGTDGTLSLENFVQVFSKTVYLTAIKNSLWISVWSTAAGLAVDFILALTLTNAGKTKKDWYLSLLNLTSTFAGLPLTLSFVTILGTSGVFVLISQKIGFSPLAGYDLYSLKGMFPIYLYFQIPTGTLLLIPAFGKVKKEWREAAILMNCGALRFWFRIGIPVLMPAIMGTTGMLFANALTAYTTPYLLVNDSIALLPIKIADMFVGDIKQRPGLGSALSIVLLALMLAVLGITNLVKRKFEKGQN